MGREDTGYWHGQAKNYHRAAESKRVRRPPFVSRHNKAAEKTAAVQDASRSLERRENLVANQRSLESLHCREGFLTTDFMDNADGKRRHGVLARTGKELSQSGGVEKSEMPTFCEQAQQSGRKDSRSPRRFAKFGAQE